MRLYTPQSMEQEKIYFNQFESAERGAEKKAVGDYTQLSLPSDWGADGVDVIVSRVRIDWLPHQGWDKGTKKVGGYRPRHRS